MMTVTEQNASLHHRSQVMIQPCEYLRDCYGDDLMAYGQIDCCGKTLSVFRAGEKYVVALAVTNGMRMLLEDACPDTLIERAERKLQVFAERTRRRDQMERANAKSAKSSLVAQTKLLPDYPQRSATGSATL
ncbi:MAG: hypothetical protein PVI92_16050 [Chromatiales bacterium]|jgi:hypothetical protein